MEIIDYLYEFGSFIFTCLLILVNLDVCYVIVCYFGVSSLVVWLLSISWSIEVIVLRVICVVVETVNLVAVLL